MAKLLGVRVIFDSRKEIYNAMNTCPICKSHNYTTKKYCASYRVNAQFISVYTQECLSYNSKWEVEIDEEDE